METRLVEAPHGGYRRVHAPVSRSHTVHCAIQVATFLKKDSTPDESAPIPLRIRNPRAMPTMPRRRMESVRAQATSLDQGIDLRVMPTRRVH